MKAGVSQRKNPLTTKVAFGLSGQIIIIPENIRQAIFSHSPHHFFHHLETAGKNVFHFALEKGKLGPYYEAQMSSLP